MGSISTQTFSDLFRVWSQSPDLNQSLGSGWVSDSKTFTEWSWSHCCHLGLGQRFIFQQEKVQTALVQVIIKDPTSFLSAFLSVIGKAVNIFVRVIYMQEFQTFFTLSLYYIILWYLCAEFWGEKLIEQGHVRKQRRNVFLPAPI